MSYMTDYQLDWSDDTVSFEDIVAVIMESKEGPPEHWRDVLEYCEPASWNDHEADMARVSGRWPKVLFTLHGRGEDMDDFWKAYFLGGKVEVVVGEMVFPDFDPANLREPGGR